MAQTPAFYFLRHGETDWNLTGQLQGHVDVPLNNTGRAQALAWQPTVQNLPISYVYHSDLCRATETAEILSANTNWQLTPLPQLRAPNFGSNHGLTHTQIEKTYHANPSAYKISQDGFFYALDGETADVFDTRISQALEGLLINKLSASFLIVSHGETFKTILRHLKANGTEVQRPQNC